MSGKIVEFLVEEDSTVAVGQDLLRLEPGEGVSTSDDEAPKAAPEGGARSEPKNPEEGNKDKAAPAAGKEKDAPEKVLKEQDEKAPGMESSVHEKPPPKKEDKPAPKEDKPKPPPPSPKEKQPKEKEAKPEPGKSVNSRNETRVNLIHKCKEELS